jgi:hypothetical protein
MAAKITDLNDFWIKKALQAVDMPCVNHSWNAVVYIYEETHTFLS